MTLLNSHLHYSMYVLYVFEDIEYWRQVLVRIEHLKLTKNTALVSLFWLDKNESFKVLGKLIKTNNNLEGINLCKRNFLWGDLC